MQSGLDSSAALIDFISSAQKDDLRQLLRYAGEVLPDGEDGVVHLRAALMGYLTLAPGHLFMSLRAMRRIPDQTVV